MGELQAFYARRRKVTFVIALASVLQAILFGSSVLIEGLTTTFDEPGRNYAFHGLYAKVLITPVANAVGAQMMWTFKRRPELRVPVLGWGVFLQGFGFVVAGAGADACATYGRGSTGGVVLLYLGLTLFVGVAEGLLELIVCYWGLLYWNVDGQKGKGVGIFGGAMGLGAVFWTLVSLWLLTSASLATTLYCLGAIQFVMALPVASAVRSGVLSHPPTEAEFNAWTGHEESRVTKEDCPAGRPPGTSPLFPEKIETTAEMLRHPVAWMQLIYLMITAFNGYASKTLLSSMYSSIFDLSRVEAGYLAAASLVLFALGRFAIPYYFIDRIGNSSLVIVAAAQLGAAGVLAALPSLARADNTAGFVVLKSIDGLLFAVSASVSAAMGVQLFGSDSLITIMAPGWIFYGVAAAAGPIVAYCVSQNRVYRGKSEAGAYNPFFYAAAGLSFGNFLLVGTSRWLERRAIAAEAAERA